MNEERENSAHSIDERPIEAATWRKGKKVRKDNEDLSYISWLRKTTQKESIKEMSNG